MPHYLVKNHLLDSESIANCCREKLNLPIYDLKQFDAKTLKKGLISAELMLRYHVIPILHKNNVLHLGMTDPAWQAAIDMISFQTGCTIIPVLLREDELMQLFENHFDQPTFLKQLELTLSKEFLTEENSEPPEKNTTPHDEPVIQLVDHIIKRALNDASSDIHIEPYEHQCRVRYRKEGMLYDMTTFPHNITSRLITRLKVMAKMDIAERRLPQDGRVFLHETDIRINTCPTLFGEKIVLRIMDANKQFLDIPSLGFTLSQQTLFLKNISRSQGLILVTGPTGSGKTVTLYSALRHLNTIEKNISTVEDPVEIKLHGINQVNINPKIGLNFATVLRAFLRQDPDILMIGEIRDKETAGIAIQAAQTGHLVFSTLHTNNATETVMRLQSMGIDTYNMMHAVSLIIAQRLIRKLCTHCKQPEILPLHLKQKYKLYHTVYTPTGCSHCLQGYQGRTGIYEFLLPTETSLLTPQNTTKNEEFPALFDQGLEKVREGITSLAEIIRVLQ